MSPSPSIRRVGASAPIVLALAAMFGCAAAALAQAPAAPLKKLAVRFGWQPLSGGSAAIAMYMIREQLFEKEAAKLGYEITPEWKTFAAGPPSNEAMLSGQLDIDMHLSALPTVARLATGVPVVPIATVGSNIANALMVAPNSPINDVALLPGKTVGLPIGTSAHYVLASIVETHFSSSIEQQGIRLVNMPVSEAIKMPTGIDVAAVWVPVRFIGPQLGIAELLVDANGYTGKGHKSAGIRLPEVKKSWAYPEGYNTDRLYAFAREKFLSDHPDVVLAFIRAHMQAQAMTLVDHAGLVALANATWKQPEMVAETTLQTYAETSGIRMTPAILEWDVLTLIKASEYLTFMKIRDTPLTWEGLKPILTKSALVQKRAWETSSPKLPVEQMVKGFSGTTKLYGQITINGGAPVWEWADTADWGKRIYIKGPFN
jgi:ABC-type nitrate/sulfonate/bicarbonate transport system substrate-binding protein